MTEIKTSLFQGITTPLPELYNQISNLGWTVSKVAWDKKTDSFIAEAKGPSGDKVSKNGPNDATAVGNLLIAIMRRSHIRSAAQWKVSMWKKHWHDDKEAVAEAYAKAPIYNPKAAAAFKELGDDSVRRLEVLKQHLHVEPTHNPAPYASAKEMADDVHSKRHLFVSRHDLEHPVWSPAQAFAFRAVHDVLGHTVSGGEFDWHGANLATAAHMPLLSPTAQQALFTQVVAQHAYGHHYRNLGPQKVALFPEFVEGHQNEENGLGHMGVHPSQSIIPSPHPQALTPYQGSSLQTRRYASLFTDPNQGWSSGFDPMQVETHGVGNAYLDHGDPVQSAAVMENAALIDTKWHSLKNGDGSFDRDRAKLAICNAFRVVLLSPRKDLRWNAIHYQDIAHIPASNTDPKLYWDTLEGKRRSWNKAQGIDENAHMIFYKFLKPFQSIIYQMNHGLGYEGAREEAEKTLHSWWVEEQQRIEMEDDDKPSDKQKSADEIERRANEALAKRIQLFIKDKTNPKTDVSVTEQPSLFASRIADHDYDPRWDYDVLEDQYHHPLLQEAQAIATQAHPKATVHPVDLSESDSVAKYIDGTYSAPTIIFDPFAHERAHPSEVANSIHHELRHAEQESNGEEYDEDDAEHGWRTAADEMDDPQWKPTELTPEAYEQKIKDGIFTKPPKIPQGAKPLNVFTGEDSLKYGAFMGTHLKAISKISQHADEILEAALEDVHMHDGTGHHFRATVLALGVSGVGPKVCSFAWLLLQPMTSQLATIDTHMMDVLGHDYEKEMGNRDYFKFERELAAGRDASGYGNVPLGTFQWGMWDYKRTGEGSHQDHSAMRVLDPAHHASIDWASKAGNLKGESWLEQAPDWWRNTQAARDEVARQWDENEGKKHPQGAIPYQVKTLAKIAKGKLSEDEFHVGITLPEEIFPKLLEIAQEAGCDELEKPENYHITFFWTTEGYKDKELHDWIDDSSVSGLRFYNARLGTFPSDDRHAVVLRLDAPEAKVLANQLMDEAEDRGMDIKRFEGGWKAHITLGWKKENGAKGKYPEISFRAGPLYVSIPRALRESAVRKSDFAGTIDPTQGPMGKAKQMFPHLTTEEIWKFQEDLQSEAS